MRIAPIEVSSLLSKAPPHSHQRSGGEEERGGGSPLDSASPSSHPAPVRGEKPVPQHAETVKPIVNGMQVGLEFVQDHATGRSVIRVYDRESGELIRQIPPEEVLAFLRQLAADKGALVSKRL